MKGLSKRSVALLISMQQVLSVGFCLGALYKKSASLTRLAGNANLEANDPRPLDQAVLRMRETYGFLVDYEDPVYSANDTQEMNSLSWKAKHPESHNYVIRGSTFKVSFSEHLEQADYGLLQSLRSVVSAYNNTQNPGRFTVKSESQIRAAVIPITGSILDTVISTQAGAKTPFAEETEILTAISRKSSTPVILGALPHTRLFDNTTVLDQGGQASAREKLLSLCASMKWPLVWRMLYDANEHRYYFNLFIATQSYENGSGETVERPLDK